MSIERPKDGEIRYTNPGESEEKRHTFDLHIEGKTIGAAEVLYLSKPLPHYNVSDIYVFSEFHGKGYGSKILDQVEHFIQERDKPGVLVDAIIEGEAAQGMYERRGWKRVPDSYGLHVFNWPDGVSLDILKGYGARYTAHSDRPGFKEILNDEH